MQAIAIPHKQLAHMPLLMSAPVHWLSVQFSELVTAHVHYGLTQL